MTSSSVVNPELSFAASLVVTANPGMRKGDWWASWYCKLFGHRVVSLPPMSPEHKQFQDAYEEYPGGLRTRKNMKKKLMICAALAATMLMAQEPAVMSCSGDPQAAYQAILNRLKKEGLEIDSASKDAGIQTSLVVTGKYRQTGSYTKITFISDGDKTEARIAVYEEKRYKALKTEPWSEPKVNVERSQAVAYRLKQELGW
jgi:hypothetical protein